VAHALEQLQQRFMLLLHGVHDRCGCRRMLLQGGEEESLLVVVVRVQGVIEKVKVLREVQRLPSLQRKHGEG